MPDREDSGDRRLGRNSRWSVLRVVVGEQTDVRVRLERVAVHLQLEVELAAWVLAGDQDENHVTTVTKKHAMPSTIEMRIAGMAQINRRPAVRRLTGSVVVEVVLHRRLAVVVDEPRVLVEQQPGVRVGAGWRSRASGC